MGPIFSRPSCDELYFKYPSTVAGSKWFIQYRNTGSFRSCCKSFGKFGGRDTGHPNKYSNSYSEVSLWVMCLSTINPSFWY
jgi:hypothetical protein